MTVEICEKSLDLALIKASGQLGIPHKNLGYEIIKEEKKLWGLLGKKITIKAWEKQRNSSPERKTRRKQSERQEKAPAVDAKVLKKLENFCQKLCSMIADEEIKLTITKREAHYVLSCQSDYLAEKLAKVPKLAESIERIMLRVFKDEINDRSFRLFFDVNDVRLNKEKDLIVLARNLSKKAAKTKRTITLNYKHAHDRKIVHKALDSDTKVYTKSVGSGAGRKLLIIPSKGREIRNSRHD